AAADPTTVLGQLTTNCGFSLLPTQRDAWLVQIELVRSLLEGMTGAVFFEFNIPRMGRRIDTVLLIGPAIFVLEFKIGEELFERSAVDQVWDYALDLKNFHQDSHNAPIIPILVATESSNCPTITPHQDADLVFRPILVNSAGLRSAIDSALA